jgi:hypothetical protein
VRVLRIRAARQRRPSHEPAAGDGVPARGACSHGGLLARGARQHRDRDVHRQQLDAAVQRPGSPRGRRRRAGDRNVDTAPQPYYVLERTTVEATHVFWPTRMAATPAVVNGLGIEATWFPANTKLMSTDGTRLLTVAVDWRGASQGRERALAEAMSRTYLTGPRGKRASARARGAPAP